MIHDKKLLGACWRNGAGKREAILDRDDAG